jgi:hypothetical protein
MCPGHSQSWPGLGTAGPSYLNASGQMAPGLRCLTTDFAETGAASWWYYCCVLGGHGMTSVFVRRGVGGSIPKTKKILPSAAVLMRFARRGVFCRILPEDFAAAHGRLFCHPCAEATVRRRMATRVHTFPIPAPPTQLVSDVAKYQNCEVQVALERTACHNPPQNPLPTATASKCIHGRTFRGSQVCPANALPD